MNCLICREAVLMNGLTAVHLARDEMKYVIDHVPARLCPSCGEAYLEEQVAETLLLQAIELSRTGILESVIEYNTLS
jgi:YgiT-type zinc finger domain-containing protein